MRVNRTFSSFFLYLFMALPLLCRGEFQEDCTACCAEQECCFELWSYPLRYYVDHVEGRWLDNHQGYTSAGVFLSLPNFENYCWIPFVDVRGHIFNNGRKAGNVGLGLRYVDFCNGRVFGANIYYDSRQASWDSAFRQWGIGCEILSAYWDLRINTYFPITKWERSRRFIFDDFEGDFFASCRERRRALGGFDIEFGRWLSCPYDWFNFYGAVGGYFYAGKKRHRHVVGGDIRLATQFYRYFNFEVRGGYDGVYHGNIQARITFTYPFEYCDFDLATCCTSALAYQPVQRQEIIALSKKDCCWKWNWSGDETCGCGCGGDCSD